ncbi:MAG: hypothetical protein J0L51_00480 [Rhizobiales bacterium]|nr:hypothetical protein [Hyphomicrobiales bacterium]
MARPHDAQNGRNDFVIEPGGRDEPPIGGELKASGVRWDLVMTLFLRLAATICMLKGVAFWALILGFGDLPLGEEPRLRQAIIVAFALLNCSAAVGLWLLATWGTSLWLFLSTIEFVLGATGFARTIGLFTAVGAGIMIAVFFILTFAFRRQKF